MSVTAPLTRRVRAQLQRTAAAWHGYTLPPGANPLLPVKLSMIRRASKILGMRSFADLGGVWGVEGGYTFYALDRLPIERAYLVDTDFTPTVRGRAGDHGALQLVEVEMGSREAIERVAPIDAVFLFDVLLHQVDPDWAEVLRRYAEVAETLLIFNQQYTGERTVRFIELGPDEFFRQVPHTPDEPLFRTFFDRLDEIHPRYDRRYRDIHNVWQWGITTPDLRQCMHDLSYREVFHRRCGRWPGLPRIENQAFIFTRERAARA